MQTPMPTSPQTEPAGRSLPVAASVEVVPGGRHDLRFLRALRRIIRALGHYSRRLGAEHGISSQQLVCLLRISERDGIALRELAREASLSPSTVVPIIDRLEERGFVSRRRSLSDRRIVHLHITAAGAQLLESAPSPLQDALARALVELPEGDRAQLVETLERIVDLVEVRDIEPLPLLDAGGIFSPPPPATETDAKVPESPPLGA